MIASVPFITWHEKLGHHSNATINQVLNQSNCTSLSVSSNDRTFCEFYQLVKSYKLPFVSNRVRSQVPFYLVFIDIWTFVTISLAGDKHFLSVVNDNT